MAKLHEIKTLEIETLTQMKNPSEFSNFIATLGGGGFLVAFIAIFAIVAFVIASPFGIFYSGQDSTNPDTVPVSAVKYATENDVATIDSARVEQIKTVFWDMNFISYDVEIVVHSDDEGEKGPPKGLPFGEEDDPRSDNTPTARAAVEAEFGRTRTETILHLHISHKTETEMRGIYAFSSQQNEALDGVLEYRSVLLSLIGNRTRNDDVWVNKKHMADWGYVPFYFTR